MGGTKAVLPKSKEFRRTILIFVTVGTHEQQFNRLIEELDALKERQIITTKEEIIIQTGFSDYTPKHCTFKDIISYDEMMFNMSKARIIITHGGPGSIFAALQMGKIPVVVPRDPQFSEHVDGHQIDFVKRMTNNNRVLGVFNIHDLENHLVNYEYLIKRIENLKETRTLFIQQFDKIVSNLLK